MQSKRADIRIINSETLSDNWYNLKNTLLTSSAAMATGSDKSVKCMTGGMARRSCSIIATAKPSF